MVTVEEVNKERSENQPYSSHIFVLPFMLKQEFGEQVWTDGPAEDNWKEVKLIKELPSLTTFPYEEYSGENVSADFLRRQAEFAFENYYNTEALDIIVGNKHETTDLVNNFEYSEKGLVYRITIANDTDNYEYFDLPIQYIMMRQSFKGRGNLLVIAANNYDYPHIDQVRRINQFGRRIYPPYINNPMHFEEAPYNVEVLTTEEAKSKPQINPSKLEDYYIADGIKKLLLSFFGEDIRIFDPYSRYNPDNRNIEKIIDDRMYVIYRYHLTKAHHSPQEIGKYNDVFKLDTWLSELKDQTGFDYEEAYKAADHLYTLMFMQEKDGADRSASLLYEVLDETVYKRWLNLGTLYGVTQHSMVFLHTEEMSDQPVISFLTQNVEFIFIVLMQRLGLLMYSRDAGNASVDFKPQKTLALQKDHVVFSNQFLLPEVSSQEQAVDMYKLVQEELFIEKNRKILDGQINSLFDISQTIEDINQSKVDLAQTRQNDWMNIILFAIAIVGIITGFNDFFDIFDGNKLSIIILAIYGILLIGISVVSVWLWLNPGNLRKVERKFRRKKKDRKDKNNQD